MRGRTNLETQNLTPRRNFWSLFLRFSKSVNSYDTWLFPPDAPSDSAWLKKKETASGEAWSLRTSEGKIFKWRRKYRENVNYDISMDNFLIDHNTCRSDPGHSREPHSSRLLGSEPILASKSYFWKFAKSCHRDFSIDKKSITMPAQILAAWLLIDDACSITWVGGKLYESLRRKHGWRFTAGVQSELILTSKSDISKICRSDVIEIFRLIKNQFHWQRRLRHRFQEASNGRINWLLWKALGVSLAETWLTVYRRRPVVRILELVVWGELFELGTLTSKFRVQRTAPPNNFVQSSEFNLGFAIAHSFLTEYFSRVWARGT